MNTQPHHSPGRLPHAAFYFLYYFYLGLFRPFMPSFLKTSGLKPYEIGVVFTLIAVATFVSAPAWGKSADRYNLRGLFLTAFPCLAALIMLPLILFPGFYSAILLALLQGSLIVPLIPLADSVCMTRCEENGWGYGRIRLWGTVGFLLSSSSGGFVADQFGWMAVMLLMLMLAIAIGIGGYALKANEAHARPQHHTPEPSVAPASFRSVWLNSTLVLFLLGTVLYQTAFGAYNLFFGIHMEKLGGAARYVSVGWFIGTFSEIIFFALSDKIKKSFGAIFLMGLAMLAGCFRWYFMSATESATLILVSQILHGVMLGGFVAGAIAFTHHFFPPSSKTLGQGLHNAAYNGIGGILAAQIAGWSFKEEGSALAFQLSAGLCFLAFVCLILGPGGGLNSLKSYCFGEQRKDSIRVGN